MYGWVEPEETSPNEHAKNGHYTNQTDHPESIVWYVHIGHGTIQILCLIRHENRFQLCERVYFSAWTVWKETETNKTDAMSSHSQNRLTSQKPKPSQTKVEGKVSFLFSAILQPTNRIRRLKGKQQHLGTYLRARWSFQLVFRISFWTFYFHCFHYGYRRTSLNRLMVHNANGLSSRWSSTTTGTRLWVGAAWPDSWPHKNNGNSCPTFYSTSHLDSLNTSIGEHRKCRGHGTCPWLWLRRRWWWWLSSRYSLVSWSRNKQNWPKFSIVMLTSSGHCCGSMITLFIIQSNRNRPSSTT